MNDISETSKESNYDQDEQDRKEAELAAERERRADMLKKNE